MKILFFKPNKRVNKRQRSKQAFLPKHILYGWTSLLLPTLFFISLFSPHIRTVSAAEQLSALEIAQKVFDRDRGKNSKTTAQMVLVNKKGNKRVRKFNILRLKKNELESTLIRFLEPADIEGTGFLTIEKKGWETDQFLFLPALRRTRRIVSSQKSHSFVNSDFSYEDMERHPVEDYTYLLEKSEILNNVPCYVLVSKPKDGVKSQYGKTRSYITQDSFVPLFTEFFDKKEKKIKLYKVITLKTIQNIWTESVILMESLKKNHKTYIKIDEIAYNTDMNDDAFTQQALEAY